MDVDLLAFERRVLSGGVVVGIDEVGRGALAGPVTVGAVALDRLSPPPAGLADSKRLSPRQRETLVEPLKAWALGWALGSASAAEIDTHGIRGALALAAQRALEQLSPPPTHALVDGPLNIIAPPSMGPWSDGPFVALPVTTVVRGDQQCATIAAAAILAKVARDALMSALPDAPRYGWTGNKGYGTLAHRRAIAQFGPTSEHRTSWNLLGD